MEIKAIYSFDRSISIRVLQLFMGNGIQTHEFNGEHKGRVGRNDSAKPTRAWKYRVSVSAGVEQEAGILTVSHV